MAKIAIFCNITPKNSQNCISQKRLFVWTWFIAQFNRNGHFSISV